MQASNRVEQKKFARAFHDPDVKAWNVVVAVDRISVVFAAEDKSHADELAALINACSWIEVSR